MPYLVQKHGSFWFQIHIPKALAARYGAFIRQNLQTTERSIAQPLALQLAGQWLARFASEKNAANNGFEHPLPGGPQPYLPQVPPYPPQAVLPPQHSAPEYGYVPQLPPQQAEPPPALKTKKKDRGNPIRSMDDVLAYWRQLSPDLSISTQRDVAAVVKDFKKTIRKCPHDLERLDIAAYRDKLINHVE